MYPGRTTVVLVKALVQTIGSADITQYIDSANELVTEKCAVVFPGTLQSIGSDGSPIYTPIPGGFTYSDHRLELIERWLAAHFYTVFDPRSVMEKAGPVSQYLQGKIDFALRSSLYGQNAMRLDTQGALAVMDNGMNKYAKIPPALVAGSGIGVTWLGERCPPRIVGECFPPVE